MTDRPTAADHPAATGTDRPGPPGQDRPTGTDHPRPTAADRPGPATSDRLVTLGEAAAITGQSTEAIRSRIRRRTLRAQRGNHGVWMIHLDALETGRPEPTGRDRPADHPADRGRPPATDRPTEEVTALRDRLEAVMTTLAAERLELGKLLEIAGRAEEREKAARAAQATAETAAARAEARADALAAELRELRRPWLERLARAIRGS